MPIISATVEVSRMRSASVRAVRMAPRFVGRERKRSVTPFDRSSATLTAEDEPPKSEVCTMIPGIRKST